jgi:hypothetical protein
MRGTDMDEASHIPSNEEASWDFAVRALWENHRELLAGAKGSGVTLTPAEADRLAHNIKWPPHRPPRILTDLQTRLLVGGEGSSDLMLSAADCELLARNMTTPNRPKGRQPNDYMHIALHCLISNSRPESWKRRCARPWTTSPVRAKPSSRRSRSFARNKSRIYGTRLLLPVNGGASM